MTARTHDLAAITALGIVVLANPLPEVTLSTALVAILANQIGGIAPDLDQPTAPFWHNLPSGHFFGRIFGKLLGGHRFISHSIIGLALFGFVVHWLLLFLHPIMPHVNVGLVWWAFFIGMVSHLVMDTITKEGVPWLLPIPIKFGVPPLKRLRITTGKGGELFVVFPLLLLVDIWLCAHNYNALVSYLHQHLAR
jgi:inner membrane protein